MYRSRVAPQPPLPPLLELQLCPNFLRRSTLFERSLFFASHPPGDGGRSCPVASTAGKAAPSTGVFGEAVPTEVSPENLCMNFRGMKREPG